MQEKLALVEDFPSTQSMQTCKEGTVGVASDAAPEFENFPAGQSTQASSATTLIAFPARQSRQTDWVGGAKS